MVAGLKDSGATNLAIKDLPKSTAKGANAASSVNGSMILLLIAVQNYQTVVLVVEELLQEED